MWVQTSKDEIPVGRQEEILNGKSCLALTVESIAEDFPKLEIFKERPERNLLEILSEDFLL